jgi:hypothetical protein
LRRRLEAAGAALARGAAEDTLCHIARVCAGVGGFAGAVRALGSRLDAVYDVTVTYINHEAVAASSDARPSEKSALMGGMWPQRVSFHIERVSAQSVRGAGGASAEGDARAAAWLAAAWEKKETRIAQQQAAAAVASAASTATQPTADELRAREGAAVPLELGLVLCGWAVLLALMGCALCGYGGMLLARALWLLTLCGVLGLAMVTKRSGLDGAERTLCPPPRKRA